MNQTKQILTFLTENQIMIDSLINRKPNHDRQFNDPRGEKTYARWKYD